MTQALFQILTWWRTTYGREEGQDTLEWAVVAALVVAGAAAAYGLAGAQISTMVTQALTYISGLIPGG